jgi:hypothetical protein
MNVLTLWRKKETLNWYLICDVQRACYTDLSFEFTTFEFAGVKFFCSCLVLGAFIFFELFHCLFFFFLNYIFNTRWIKNFFGGNFLATLNNNVLSNNVSYSYLHYSWFLLLVFVLSHFFFPSLHWGVFFAVAFSKWNQNSRCRAIDGEKITSPL